MENKIYKTSLTNSQNNNEDDVVSPINFTPNTPQVNYIDNNTLTDPNNQATVNLHRFGHTMTLSIYYHNTV